MFSPFDMPFQKQMQASAYSAIALFRSKPADFPLSQSAGNSLTTKLLAAAYFSPKVSALFALPETILTFKYFLVHFSFRQVRKR
jgi:hypothetical protein